MLPARTTSIARLGYVRPAGAAPPTARLRTVQSARKRFGSAQKGILVVTLGALSVVPQIGIIIVKLGEDAVTTIGLLAVAGTVSVGVRPPAYHLPGPARLIG